MAGKPSFTISFTLFLIKVLDKCIRQGKFSFSGTLQVFTFSFRGLYVHNSFSLKANNSTTMFQADHLYMKQLHDDFSS